MNTEQLTAVEKQSGNTVYLALPGGLKGKLTFLEPRILRWQVRQDGQFAPYALPRDPSHQAKIPQYPDSWPGYSRPVPEVRQDGTRILLRVESTLVTVCRETGMLQIDAGDRTVLQQLQPLSLTPEQTVLTLRRDAREQFFGGGTQNGRIFHTGNKIHISNESAWMDGGVSSPNPFFYSTGGYGILCNTFSDGYYDFGSADAGCVQITHDTDSFDGYLFLTEADNPRETVRSLLQGYYRVTGNPLLLPEYAFYQGHLNCYNRDAWSEDTGEKAWTVKGTESADSQGTTLYESGMAAGFRLRPGQHAESLNGDKPTVAAEHFPESVDTPYRFSARAMLDRYLRYDMPLGYFLPNDGYGGGYGQNGYYMQGGVDENGHSSPERLAAVQANVENLRRFTRYAAEHGVATGLWTQSDLTPDTDPDTYWHLLRDFAREVEQGGVSTLKTDVAWVGPGYSFQLSGVKTAYDLAVALGRVRPNLISLDGWAGSQRFNGVWSGDQTGGNWEYIRFHIPTYIGSSLSGNPNIGSDLDGIFGGKALIAARDFQWKAFTPVMLNMDGWGAYPKTPFTFGDPYTGICRMYLKIKARLMPYLYTAAASAANLDTGNRDTGLPMVRAMFLEFPGDGLCMGPLTQYQFMLGSALLVAPVYRSTRPDGLGNDVRSGIYLPDPDTVWVDYFTGEKYRGGQILDNFDAPLWKLPLFVRNGSILPLYPENNNPGQVDRSRRMAAFWPCGDSRFTVYEDDGMHIENDPVQDREYGQIDRICYGPHVSVTYTSSVRGDTAVLQILPARGSYPGYCPIRESTFAVHLTQKPGKVTAMCGAHSLTLREAGSREEFDRAILSGDQGIVFYDATPGLRTYASPAEVRLHRMTQAVKTAPVLYVRLGAADTSLYTQTVTVCGFVSSWDALPDRENPRLTAPVPEEDSDAAAPTELQLHWQPVPGALCYELLADGQLHSMGNTLLFRHDGLAYESRHRYQLRCRNRDGVSAWSPELQCVTQIDPWRNEIGARGRITFSGDDGAGPLRYATDHSTKGLFFSVDDVVGKKLPFLYDFGAVYELSHFDYYPRDNYGSGCVRQMEISASLDGTHWKTVWDGSRHPDWTYDRELSVEENVKTVPLSQVCARYLRLRVLKSNRNYFAAHELPVYKKDGSLPFSPGSTNRNLTVSDDDYTNMKNYLGTCRKDGAVFTDQIEKRCGDLNLNGIYDVYDYAHTMFRLDGGTCQSGAVRGHVRLQVPTVPAAPGQAVTVALTAENAENLNAFGKVLPYDPAVWEFVSAQGTEAIGQMENLTVSRVYPDGSAYVNLAFVSRGDRPLYSGSGQVGSVTMRAKQNADSAALFPCTELALIGPDFSCIGEP